MPGGAGARDVTCRRTASQDTIVRAIAVDDPNLLVSYIDDPRRRNTPDAGDPALDFVRHAVDRHPPLRGRRRQGQREVGLLEHAGLRDIVDRDANPVRRRRQLDDRGGAQPREERVVHRRPTERPPTVERWNDRDAVAEIEIPLDDRTNRVTVEPGRGKDHDAGLHAGRIRQADAHTARRRVLRIGASGEHGEGTEHERQRSSHYRMRVGSKLKTTGSTSSGYPAGSGPNALAAAAASIDPIASRSKAYTPDRTTMRWPVTLPSR